MAKIVKFDRFKVIKASAKEMFEAVLNKWYCPKCWEEFKKRAVWHPEDAMIEDRNFTCYGLALGIDFKQ